jgi:hypothetical protein
MTACTCNQTAPLCDDCRLRRQLIVAERIATLPEPKPNQPFANRSPTEADEP